MNRRYEEIDYTFPSKRQTDSESQNGSNNRSERIDLQWDRRNNLIVIDEQQSNIVESRKIEIVEKELHNKRCSLDPDRCE